VLYYGVFSSNMATDSKNKINADKQIKEVREKFGMPPLSSQKSYEERLEEYNKRKNKIIKKV